jgi:Uma2 family endonuclease
VSTQPEPRRFSVAEYLRLAEVGILGPEEKVELIDGQVVGMSPQGAPHAAVVNELAAMLGEVYPRNRFCVRVQSTFAAADDSAPEPDIAVVAGRCLDHVQQLPRTALLVIEVSQTSQRLDRGRKSDLYASAGVAEYWVVDLARRTVEVRREPSTAGYKSIRILQPADSIQPLPAEGATLREVRAEELLPRLSGTPGGEIS